MAKEPADDFIGRVREYQGEGYDSSHAFGLAVFETRIEHWPSGWGDDFVALVFGDFQPPNEALVFERLGITIEPEKQKELVLRSALTVLRARVAVSEKSVAAVKDAARRLNLLVGVLSYAHQGAPISWWSFIIDPTGGSLHYKLGERSPDPLLELIGLLPLEGQMKVTTALYWIREPRSMLLEHHRSDHLAVYAGYWNAFECLVDAVDSIAPRARPTRAQKTQSISAYLEKTGGTLSPGDITDLYRKVVDTGLRPKAEHAIRMCTGDRAEHFIRQCFDYEPADRGLYAIRNAINHGTVDVNDPETAMIVEARFSELWGLVFSMVGGILQLNVKKLSSPHGR